MKHNKPTGVKREVLDMSLLETLRKNLSPEVFAQVTDALGDDFNFDLVPRSRLNKVIAQRDTARKDLEKLTQGGSGLDEDDEDDDDGDDGDGKSKLQQGKKTKGGFSQKDLDAAVNKAKEDAATEVKNLRLQFAATEKLRSANFVDPELVLSSGLIDFTKVTTDDKGVITGGLDEQIAEITKSKPFLVSTKQGGGAKTGTGKEGGADQFAAVTTREEFLKLSADKQIEFKKANPEVFAGFMKGL